MNKPLETMESALQRHDWCAAEKLCDMRPSEGEGRAWNAIWRTQIAQCKADTSARRWWGDRLLDAIREIKRPSTKLLYAAATQLHLQNRMHAALGLLDLIQNGDEPRADVLRRRVEYALRIRALHNMSGWQDHPSILAVGHACMGHNMATRWGFAEPLVDGPFAKAVFRAPNVALDEKFERLISPDAYVYAPTKSSPNTITIPAYKAMLHHEVGPYWLDDGATRVTSFYQKRVANFQAITARKTLFILEQHVLFDIDELMRSLDRHFTGEVRMLVINTHPMTPTSNDPRIRVLVAKLDASVHWWLPLVYNSLAGEAYERPIADAISQEIEKLAR